MINQTKLEVADQVVKASPPVAVGALTIAGIGLSDLVLYATLFYTLCQTFLLLRDRVWREYKRSRDERNREITEGTSS